MKCELCINVATEKHHVTYFPEQTIGVCAYHGDQIHSHPLQYAKWIKFRPGDASSFYNQKERVDKFLKYLSKAGRRFGRRR